MSPFDIINKISTTEEDSWEDIGEKDYNAFMVNRGLSYHLDCIMHANELNMRYHLPKETQYDYLRLAIRPKKKRFAKWASSKKDKEVGLVSEYFNLSLGKSVGVRSLLSDLDLQEIEQRLNKGGTK